MNISIPPSYLEEMSIPLLPPMLVRQNQFGVDYRWIWNMRHQSFFYSKMVHVLITEPWTEYMNVLNDYVHIRLARRCIYRLHNRLIQRTIDRLFASILPIELTRLISEFLEIPQNY